ncbi:MAG: hypothetical protein P0S96_03645 [Simkaniaceae bacterium]|nr:hypothetical protein [Candidatus Sacchlamyda saccharinae]
MAISQPPSCLAARILDKEVPNPNANNSTSRTFVVRKALTTSAFCVALLETALSAIAATFLSPAYLAAPEKYSIITSHTSASAKATAQAFRRTFGIESKEAENKPQIDTQIAKKEAVKSNLQHILALAKKHETALTVAAVATALTGAYYFGLFDYTGNMLALHSTPLPPQEPVQAAVKAATGSLPTQLLTCPAQLEGNATSIVTEAVQQVPSAPLALYKTPTELLATSPSVCLDPPMTPWTNATVASPLSFTPASAGSTALSLYNPPIAPTSSPATSPFPPLNFRSDFAARFAPQAPAPLASYTEKVDQIFSSNQCFPAPTTSWANATSSAAPPSFTPPSTALTLYNPLSSASSADIAANGNRHFRNFLDRVTKNDLRESLHISTVAAAGLALVSAPFSAPLAAGITMTGVINFGAHCMLATLTNS